jgi:hypothetical protein
MVPGKAFSAALDQGYVPALKVAATAVVSALKSRA